MQTSVRIALLAALVAGGSASAQSPAACDLSRGKEVFQVCSACHSLTAKESMREGPTLAGVMGRQAGSQPGFAFSAGMRAVGWNWSPTLLDSFIATPRKTIRGTTMLFTGLRDSADRAAVVCYITAASAAAKP